MFLIETRRILDELACIIPSANRFLHDKEFIKCLSEEIEYSIKEKLETPKVLFVVDEMGSVNFSGIVSNIPNDPTYIAISLKEDLQEQNKLKEQEKIIEKAAKIAEETLDLDLKLKKRELLDKLLKKDK